MNKKAKAFLGGNLLRQRLHFNINQQRRTKQKPDMLSNTVIGFKEKQPVYE